MMTEEIDDDEFSDDFNFNIVKPTTEEVDLGDDDELCEPEPIESSLPSEAVVRFRGAKSDNEILELEPDSPDGIKVFIGSDGRTHKEVPRARQAFEDYYKMGRSRSMKKLAEIYASDAYPAWSNNVEAIARKLQDYSSNLDWQNRIRMYVMQESASAIAAAQRSAATSKRNRITRASKMQQIGEKILEKARIFEVGTDDELSVAEARQLIKPATVLLQLGMQLERVEIGESLSNIKPPKDIADMTDDELSEFIGVLMTELG